MKISLLDPGLVLLGGHHFDLDLRLGRELARRGHDVVVHGFADLNPELRTAAEASGMEIHPTFRVPTYGAMPPAGSAIDAHRAMEQATAEDLAGVPPTDLWIWPTLAPYQFAAAAMQTHSVPQIGGSWWLPRFPHPIGAHRWAHAARLVAKARRPITVGAYDELLCRAYAGFSPGLDVVRLPCPHDGAPNPHRPAALRRIGFLGHHRAGRGIDLVPQLVAALLERGFEVVVQDSGRTLQRQGDNPRLEVLPFVKNFAAEIAGCDLVIWPSQWEAYLQQYSGVVSECIATGVPVIVPSGCMPAEVLARFKCGNFFHYHSRDAVLEAVDDAADNFPAVVARARAAAKAWHSENGTARLAEWIESHSGGAS